MEKLLSAAFCLVPLLVGGAFISTGMYNRAQYEPASFWGSIVFGAFFLLIGVFIFFALTLPEWRGSKSTKSEIKRMTSANGEEEKVGSVERLVADFKKTYSDFFSAQHITENSTLQSTATQMFWHILYLQKRRMEKKGVTMELFSERNGENAKALEKNAYSDAKFMVTDVKERIRAIRIFRRKTGAAYRKKSTELAHYTVARARTTSSEDRVICPNCGNETTRDNLLDGCDFCKTKFTVEDLGRRVNSFTLRDDYVTMLKKYEDIRESLLPWGMAIFISPIFLISLIGMLSAWNSLEAGFFMKLFAVIACTALLTALGGSLVRFLYPIVLFPLMEMSEFLIGHYSKKEIEKRRALEDTNSGVFVNMRYTDKLFSKENFLSNVQNKLAAVHYAESESEIQAFALCDLGGYLKTYRDIVDMEVIEVQMLNYAKDDAVQTVRMSVLLNLLYAGKRFKKKDERIDLTLIRSADSKTEAVCAPSVFKCKNCGNSLTLLNGGVCEYCGSKLNLSEHDWVISEYKVR